LSGSTEATLARKKFRILLVDDDPDITLTFETVLEDYGYAVDSFNDSLDAPAPIVLPPWPSDTPRHVSATVVTFNRQRINNAAADIEIRASRHR
jgi:hypothetical protein